MPDMTIVNTSPVFYLHRLGLINIFHALYGEIIVPCAVQNELEQGRKQGENVPNLYIEELRFFLLRDSELGN